MSLHIHIEHFEGPFDLLLHLIDKNELDIYQIPIAEITDQYLSYVAAMQLLELDLASEFIVMAATLVAMKSKLLLPVQADAYEEEDGFDAALQEEEMQQQLLERLLAYKQYKQAAEHLKEMADARKKIYTKAADDLTPYLRTAPEEPLEGISVFQLIEAFQTALKKQRTRQFTAIVKRDDRSVQACMTDLLNVLSTQTRLDFFDLLEKTTHRETVVVMFLALLELMKSGEVRVYQERLFSTIWLERKESKDGLSKDQNGA